MRIGSEHGLANSRLHASDFRLGILILAWPPADDGRAGLILWIWLKNLGPGLLMGLRAGVKNVWPCQAAATCRQYD